MKPAPRGAGTGNHPCASNEPHQRVVAAQALTRSTFPTGMERNMPHHSSQARNTRDVSNALSAARRAARRQAAEEKEPHDAYFFNTVARKISRPFGGPQSNTSGGGRCLYDASRVSSSHLASGQSYRPDDSVAESICIPTVIRSQNHAQAKRQGSRWRAQAACGDSSTLYPQ